MNGKQLQKASYFGRYLSFSALVNETDSWKKSDMNHQLHKMRQDAHQKAMDSMAGKFYNLHTALADIIKKIMKKADCKDRLMLWMRQAVNLNLDKQKMFT